MGRGNQTTLKKNDRGSRMTWHEDDDISSERNHPRTSTIVIHMLFLCEKKNNQRKCNRVLNLYVCASQYRMMVSRRPAALCEHQRSPPWSSWWSSLVSGTTSVWALAPSPPAHLAPSRASSLGSQPWTDSTLFVAGTTPYTLGTCCQLNGLSSPVQNIFISRIYSRVRSIARNSKGLQGVLLYLADRCNNEVQIQPL